MGGYSRYGLDKDGFDRYGFDVTGLDRDGKEDSTGRFDQSGYDIDCLNRKGKHQEVANLGVWTVTEVLHSTKENKELD